MEESNSRPDGIPEEGTYLTYIGIITSYELKRGPLQLESLESLYTLSLMMLDLI